MSICGCKNTKYQTSEVAGFRSWFATTITLLVLEMTVVKRPFVLDFAGAFLDDGPDFSDEVLADWRAEKQEQFGARWPEVQAVLRIIEGYGVFMLDVNPGNVSFGD